MTSSMPNAVALQHNFESQINDEIAFLESTTGLQATEHELRSRLNEFEYEFTAVRERHDKIFLAKPQEATKKYLDDNIFALLRNKYHKLHGMISDRLPKPSTSHDVFNSTTLGHQSHRSCSEIKLGKLDAPTFNGTYKDWLPFDNLFTSTIHNNPNMDPVIKLQRLQHSVTGDAHAIIKNLQVTGANYEVARRLLSKRFNHKRKLVNAYLEQLYILPNMKTESSQGYKTMINTLNDSISALKQLNLEIEDYQLIFHMCRKLPTTVLTLWEEAQGASTEIPAFDKFFTFLETRFRTMEMIEPATHSSKSFHVKSNQDTSTKIKQKKFVNSKPKFKPFKTVNCILCKGSHYLGKCEQFTKMQQPERFDTAKRLNCCLNCFNSAHTTNSCFSKIGCRVCGKRHHTLLHRYETNTNRQNTESNQQPTLPPHRDSFHVNCKEQTGTLLGTAKVNAMSSTGTSVTIRALIDPCSEDNYILASTVQLLHLKKYYSPSIIGVLGEEHSSDCTHRVELQFKSVNNLFSLKVSAGVVNKITSSLPSMHLPRDTFTHFNTLQLADESFNEPGEIHLLLGVNVHTKIMLGEFKRLGDNLIAEKTLLGYLIRGQACAPTGRPSLVLMTHASTVDLNAQIQKFWEIEEVNHSKPMHPNDELCENIFKASVHQDSDGFLNVDLPFKGNEIPTIGPSRFMAVKRFLSLERKLNSNEHLKNDYHAQIKNYLDSNHLTESLMPFENGYYLPHHAVVKESSTTTKVRVVFDASCRSLDGSSLNDHLLTGPKLQSDIRDILFNWRQYPFALTADIEKMYRMFLINPKHQQFQKIVWRFNEKDPIKDYILRTATFGTSCAPFLAIRCLQYIADLHKSTNPVAFQAIKRDFYVDDFISGGFTVQEALDKQTQVRSTLQKYNLTLRKWSSNNKQSIANVPDDLLEISRDLSFDETEFRKTLGIFWSQQKDSFFFSISLPTDSKETFTKRKILSLIARLYDPLGWVSPCTMVAKQIMQKIWQTKTGWDETVEASLAKQFTDFLTQLPELEKFSIPRWVNIPDKTSPLTVFGFSDASDKGYSAVVYLVNPTPSSSKQNLILLTSKTKVADLKYQSTARLELNGALLLSELLKWTVNLYKPRSVEVRAFCDSKIVLAWLQGHPSKWQTYIANRTTQILEWMEPSQWSYIDTKLNPADCASRGLLPQELLTHDLWLNGPNLESLKYDQSLNLDEEQTKLINETVKKNSLVLNTTSREPFHLLSYFSNHSKLVKRIGAITDFPKRILTKILSKGSTGKESFNLILKQIEDAETVVFRILQHEAYYDEIKCLRTKKEIAKDSKIKTLHPFLDGNDILRVGGRLQNSDLTFDQQHPIILPAKHQVVTNVIAEAHDKTLHGTELLTLAYVRNRFHIPRVSEKVRKFIHNCMICFKLAKQQQEILMGSLPTARVNFSNPFEHCGVDYAGPLTIKAYSGRCKKFTKGYIAVFVCLCTKAIHIELVSDLTSLSFLAAFKRFSGRRGRVYHLYSDNGTNFVGANKILQNDIKLAEQSWKSDLEPDFRELNTEWHFIPPATPHFGGLWEAGVKSIKSHLKKTVGLSLLTFEEMSTVLVQIEAVLNSRPLCPMSNNPNEYNYITPAHFLIGRSLVAPPEKCINMDKQGYLPRWQHVQAIFQRFARLWKRDHLQNLQNRPKGLATTVHYQPGQLVLLMDDDVSPTLWPTVRIQETHPGKDGVVRVVTVRSTNGKIFKRPAVKLRYLPCNDPLEI